MVAASALLTRRQAGPQTPVGAAALLRLRRDRPPAAGHLREAPVSLGLQADGNLLQVFSSPATGSWTIVSTSPGGLACVLAAGQNWETVTPAKLDPAA